MSDNLKISKRLGVLFLKTKILCFGRYAIEVPQETELIYGNISVPSKIEVIKGGIVAKDEKIKEDIKKIKINDSSSEIIYNGKGPIENSWQLRYFENKFSKEDGDVFFRTYINKGDITFILSGSTPKGRTITSAAATQLTRINNLRLREKNEIPAEPGHCLGDGFMSDSNYNVQEMADAGLYFPNFPDVTFSITSNKDAYGDYPAAEYDEKVRGELSLLARIQQAKDQQGKNYPARTLLREGKRDVQHWHGEESLIRRTDGVHDFEWTLVGTPLDVAYPSVLEASMYTKVAHNMVGAAEASSLTDEEAIALWDKLLSGLKFRVKVPGAPPGSYYIDPDKPAQ
ncbi:T6SS immunity protein Tli4 family protein [Janthinobacterium lividum]|uniref:T6SS immunity protein Tli4 family protein n=1 Tax=Janthinobacterium lividum TaxID=29581 RepID=A0ABU0XR40_9BURK|nr:T6SS immunity protein Tli4 family protein [Janthinobacterium lividum]MDQ4625419.1 T6SS immunity protein Tli4 family protein [Janthinobacterium lividum]MDQ4672978.1 T6SS immunity protein Tli4 family protein [Janthinobacterium lividum]MDQ4683706.1 T6SS immunity protein Tli4 family protein [Janthinobacterium lividum]